MSELVGDAYVRIHADTKFMHDAIKRDMKKIGKEGADSLLADFDKTIHDTADTKLRRAQHDLAEAIVGRDFDAMLKRSNLSVERFVDKIAVDLAHIQDVGKFDELDAAFNTLDDWAERKMVSREADRIAAALDKDWASAQRVNKSFKEQERIGQSLADHFEHLDTNAWHHGIKTLTSDIERSNKALDLAEEAARKMNDELRRTGHVDTDRTFARLRNGVHRVDQDLERFAARGGLGRMFGKGSRNNFFNAIGSAVDGVQALVAGLIRLPFTIIDKFTNGLGSMIDSFKGLREAGASIPAILGKGLASAASTAIPALIALAAAVGGLAVALPAMVSLASALLGGLTAAAGALYFAIAGSLLPLVPIIVAVGAALAPIALGFVSIHAAIKKNSKSVSGITKDWKDFKKAVQPFVKEFTHEVNLFAGALGGVVPFVRDMGNSVLDFMKTLRQVFSTPGMDKFIDAWQTTMPIIFDNVGRAVDNLLAGLTAFFAPILPFAERLSAKFEDLATSFNAWAQSAKGQNSIKDFMEKAWTAAGLLWDILGNVVEALHNLFGIGQEDAGKSLLQVIDDLTERFKNFTESSQGKESISEWFTRAKEAGDKLFTGIGQIFDFFATLDTKQAHDDLMSFLGAMERIGGYADDFAKALALIGQAVQSTSSFSILGVYFGSTADKIGGAINRIGLYASTLPTLLQGPLLAVPGVIVGALQNVPGLLLSPWTTGINLVMSAVRGLLPSVQTALSALPAVARSAVSAVIELLPSPFRTAIQAVTTLLTGGPSAIRSGMSGWALAAAGAVAGIYSFLTQPFRDAIDYIRGILADIRSAASNIPGVDALGKLIRHAAGGILYGPTMIAPGHLAGEAGREAIVPLDRPLSQIDPSVRALAAFAQGKAGERTNSGRQVTVMPGAISVSLPNTNPMLAAEALVDRLVAAL